MCAVQIQHLRISKMYNLWQSQCHNRVLELGFTTFLVEMLSVIKPIPAMAEAMMMQAKWLKPCDLSQRRNVKRCRQTSRSRYISGLFLEGSMMIINIYIYTLIGGFNPLKNTKVRLDHHPNHWGKSLLYFEQSPP